MRFRLYYRGALHANARPREKSCLRSIFHTQLKTLWDQKPLNEIKKYTDPEYQPNTCYLGFHKGDYTYFPIISERISTVAELDILMLRPSDPGRIRGGGGDIDNRLKALLDSLSVPQHSQVSHNDTESKIKNIFCLLEDDKLITRLNVETDRLLDIKQDNGNEVVLIVQVHVIASSGRFCNIGISL